MKQDEVRKGMFLSGIAGQHPEFIMNNTKAEGSSRDRRSLLRAASALFSASEDVSPRTHAAVGANVRSCSRIYHETKHFSGNHSLPECQKSVLMRRHLVQP